MSTREQQDLASPERSSSTSPPRLVGDAGGPLASVDSGVPLVAGHELDGLIAERVMGVRFWLERRGEYTLAVWKPAGAREPWKSSRDGTPERYRQVDAATAMATGFYGDWPPRYSRDIAAAWQVVEKMRAGGWHYTLNAGPDDLHDAEFWDGNVASAGAVAATAPLAICLAALKAVSND